MKLSWKDLVTTLIVIAGGLIVYAKYYSYPWALIGSWRSSSAMLALGGLVLFAFSRFDFTNKSILNVAEMILGAVAVVVAVAGMTFTSHQIFYSLAALIAVFWLIDTIRHIRHSLVGDDNYETTSFHHQAHVH